MVIVNTSRDIRQYFPLPLIQAQHKIYFQSFTTRITQAQIITELDVYSCLENSASNTELEILRCKQSTLLTYEFSSALAIHKNGQNFNSYWMT